MNPHQILEEICQRQGVKPYTARHFLPMVRRALAATPDVRTRILEVVERALQREERKRLLDRVPRDAEQDLLLGVARSLHGWQPPRWLMRWIRGGDGEAEAS